MEQALVTFLIIALLTGFIHGQELLPPGPVNGEVGESVVFETLELPQPTDSIRWSFNGKSVITFTPPGPENVDPSYTGRAFLNGTTGALELRVLTMADSGEYNLTFTSEDGVQTEDKTLLKVFEAVSGITLTVPEEILIEDRSSANLTCTGNGTIVTTEWMRDGTLLVPGGNIMFSDDNSSVIFSPVKRTDVGEYRCTISNPVSSISSTYRMNVNYGPDVTILGTHNIEEGSDILLLCSYESVPSATVRWTVNGISAGDTPLYIKKNSELKDSGNYNCTAWNSVTNIRTTALYNLRVTAISSELSPGAAAGIAVGTILGVEILAVLLYFLITHLSPRKSPKPLGTISSPTQLNIQQTDHTYSNSDAVNESQISLPRVQKPNEPIYQNGPVLPPRDQLPELPKRNKPKESDLYCSVLERPNFK
ncbi:carcinoembryonic antigen-related cell adhesion molecule 6-like [Trichomycterus rosablanca]|uniref:carcinoembryonic antigen-related cell adhesion molecule 6-like n=1 Tax=Trichomycterus rosablanca TaxID=2290929 RepID=UPI002F35848A